MHAEFKNKIIPVIIWTTGIISKSLTKYINNKTATLGTADLLRKAVTSEYKTFIKGNTLCVPYIVIIEQLLCFRSITVKNVYKVDNK